MKIARNYHDLRNIIEDWKQQELTTGFVPTMGALHEGHLSLIDIAKANADKSVVSIFVNPTQFAPHEDFDSYPREEQCDIEKLEAKSVDLLYLPDVKDIYPDEQVLSVRTGEAANGLESNFRPHFFDGVVTIVKILFDQVRPDTAIFGEKDYQQLQVIKDMADIYDLPVKIVGGPTIRDEEGLALSSRNAYLSAEQLQIARQLNKILRRISDNDTLLPDATRQIKDAGFDKVDYLEQRWGRLLTAAWLGQTRLIDNIPLSS